MLKVQKFLNSRGLEALRNDPFNLHVSAKDNLILLKYNQFNSDFGQELVKECRGIILENKTWKVVCHPFHKFFNIGESYAYNTIKLNESFVFEKIDGSIIKVYFYNGTWRIATNGTIDAADASNNDGISFKTLFFDVISEREFDELTENFDKENTYLFELVHPATRIVVDYGNRKELVLLGMIKNESDEIIDYDILNVRKKMEKLFNKLPIRYPRVFELSKVKDVVELSIIADDENNKGNNFEGFVVAQVHNGRILHRVKIKSAKYVNLHHIATGESVTNNLINVLIKNELDEFEVYLKKLPANVIDEYMSLKNKYFKLIKYLYDEGENYRKKAKDVTRKELALHIQTHVRKDCTGFIFKMVDDVDITPEELITSFGIKKAKSLLS